MMPASGKSQLQILWAPSNLGMLSLAGFNLLLAAFSVAMALVALGLLAFVLLREKSPESRSVKVKRSESFIPEWKKPENLNPDFLQFHTLMYPKKAEVKKPVRNNQIMEVDRREQIIDLSGLETMQAPEKPLPPLPIEEAIYENAVYIKEERMRRSPASSSSSSSLRSSPFTSSTSLAASQELPMRDFGSSSDMSEIDLVEPPAIKQIARLECSSPEERC
ncbi:hypothetical protein PRIPAC_85768 [Pristionchus pacificus]|uniref:Uncharacterized protein n=1 Tax=Pristionchus pacificus TaxID=54126 RepID=A0A2A6BNZ6_PRIPA|nr:hypothetical protein PRIPAC_85768 [Pristionchus pacificus]|eukprot:PDM67503.1 hypothetical protein PRIPAC_48920 [Pristionchus pacificus]